MTPARFPHSDTPGSTLGCQLPRAYRRLLRPSSALDAKASTTCPSPLVTHTTTPTPETNTHPHTNQGRPGNRERDRRCTPNTQIRDTPRRNTHAPAATHNRSTVQQNKQTNTTRQPTHPHPPTTPPHPTKRAGRYR